MAPATLCEEDRHKLNRMQEVVAEDVLRFTLKQSLVSSGFYDTHSSLQNYLDNPPKTSAANICQLSDTRRKNVFTRQERRRIHDDPTWETFDTGLLYKGIRWFCEEVAPIDDPVWSSDNDSLEGLLTKIHHDASNPSNHNTSSEYGAKVREQQDLYMKALEAAKTRWRIPDQLVVDEKQKVKEGIEYILECLLKQEAVLQHGNRRVQEVENSLCTIAEGVLKFILKHGKRAPDPPYPPNSCKPFQEYLNNLPQNSTAHYRHLSKKSKKRAFTKEEQIKLLDDPSLSRFDVPLLYKVIRLGCENVAPLDDPVWTEGNDELEGLLTKLKNQRNLFIHDRHVLCFDLSDKVNELKDLFMKLLDSAQVRYKIGAQEVIDEKRKVKDGIQQVLLNPN